VPRALLLISYYFLNIIYYGPIANVNFPLGPQSNKTETIKNATPKLVCRGNTRDISGETRFKEHVLQSVWSTGRYAREHNIIIICITRISTISIMIIYNAGGRYIILLSWWPAVKYPVVDTGV